MKWQYDHRIKQYLKQKYSSRYRVTKNKAKDRDQISLQSQKSDNVTKV